MKRVINPFMFDNNDASPQKKKKYDSAVIQEMLRSVDILQILEDEYDLVFDPGNKGWWNTNCPMPDHRDSSPSFGVNPELGAFNCFGCASHGDLLEFVQKVEGVSFIEAVERLAVWSGINASPDDVESYRALREIQTSVEEYLSRHAETDLPGGVQPVQFLRALSERLREYEKQVNFNPEEVAWVDEIYRKIDLLESQRDELGMRKIWDELERKMKQRRKDYLRKGSTDE